MLATLRTHRRPWGWAVLVLLLALLPLRGWAETAMHLGSAAGASEWASAAAMPCHGAAVDAEGASAGEDKAAHTPGACALCALCHGASLPAAELRFAAEPSVEAVHALPDAGVQSPALPLPERPPRG